MQNSATLSAQITNVYRNRAIGSFCQRQGLYVIPQVRWGSEETYTKKVHPEKVAFLGIEKYSIVAIGTYGCIQHRDDKYHFEAGLESMLCTLEPAVVLVYGVMPMMFLAVIFVIQNLFNMIIGQRECMEVTTNGKRIKRTILRY